MSLNSSTTGPLLPTMTDSLLAPGWEVLYKQYHSGELSVPKVPEPDWVATSACAKNKRGPKPGEHVQLFRMKSFYSQKCSLEACLVHASVCICRTIFLTGAYNNHNDSFPFVYSVASICALHQFRRARSAGGGGGVMHLLMSPAVMSQTHIGTHTCNSTPIELGFLLLSAPC